MSKVILSSKGGGKTTKAVEVCLLRGGIFVAFSAEEAKRLKDMYPELNVVSVHRAIGPDFRFAKQEPSPIFVDNADMCLEALLHRPIEVLTLTRPKSARYDKVVGWSKRNKNDKSKT